MGERKERPILFSGPMVRALLEGRKTQTRRSLRPEHVGRLLADDQSSGHEFCPYGQPGDRLWVRETWAPARNGDTGKVVAIYRADWTANGSPEGPSYDATWKGWKPSIHMSRWASRLTLEVTEVRVQRLQEISEEDARSEGVGESLVSGFTDAEATAFLGALVDGGPVQGFRVLWDSINGPTAWNANPWVWAVSFGVVTP